MDREKTAAIQPSRHQHKEQVQKTVPRVPGEYTARNMFKCNKMYRNITTLKRKLLWHLPLPFPKTPGLSSAME